jgi:hypothetical protein
MRPARPRHAAGGLLLLGLALLPGTRAGGTPLDGPNQIPVEEVHRYAQPFVTQQLPNGSYHISIRVQAHEKAEIAMALAAEATQTPGYAESAWQDLQWVIAYRLEPGGGINWDGPDDDFFFECHQHWFLIASELIRRLIDTPEELKATQRGVWRFLTGANGAEADLYLHNQQTHGPFFAYRSVTRYGMLQTQAPFKGSYEVGTALWSLSMIQDLPWMETSPPATDGLRLSEYLHSSVMQAAQSPENLGWFDPVSGQWVRSLLWDNLGWSGWEAPDWKYALNLQEGALLYKIMTGGTELDEAIRRETDRILALVQPGGVITTVPDSYGTVEHEYGEALCVLGLSAQAFLQSDPIYAAECYYAGLTVAAHVTQVFPPQSSEDGSLLLRGLARVYEAQTAIGESVAALDEPDGSGPRYGHEAGLQIWPNPMSERTTVAFALPARSNGLLWISDLTGRQVAAFTVRAADAGGGTFSWNGRDGRGRLLPGGAYRLVLDSERGRQAASVVIAR